MIKLSPRAKTILDALHNRYASQTYQRFYGKSPFRNWQIMFDRELCSIEYDSRTGIGLRHTSEWGDVIYSCIQYNGNLIVIIDNFLFNYKLLHKWFTKAEYPPIPIKHNKSITYTNFSYVKPIRSIVISDGNKAYAVQSDTNLYSLADKNKNLVIDK